MIIDINMPVADLIKDNDKLKNDLIDLGFNALANPLMVSTVGKKMSLKRGASMMKIENLEDKLSALGYEISDSSQDPEVIERKKLIKSFIERLTAGEDLESVRADFRANFEGVSSAEIMDAEEELLASGMDKAEVRKLCDVHSSLFHGMTENENEKTSYDDIPFISYFARENQKIKEILDKNDGDFEKLRGILAKHYKKKGDLIYPILKAKYNKPGPSDVMWAVDIEIVNNIKKALKLQNEDLLEKSIERAKEMTYKEENILYPLMKDTLTSQDLAILYEDLADYDHDLVAYNQEETASKALADDNYIHFARGKMRIDQLEAMLDTMEIEITFVDENDINSYYNNHEGAKLFKRPKSSLGREVYSCHPPQVEPIVRGLIKDFKEGKRDSFKLVKNIGGKDIAIGYFAVRDKKGAYKGVLETVQDLSFYIDNLNK